VTASTRLFPQQVQGAKLRLTRPLPRHGVPFFAQDAIDYLHCTLGTDQLLASVQEAARPHLGQEPRLSTSGTAPCPSPADPGSISQHGQRPLFLRRSSFSDETEHSVQCSSADLQKTPCFFSVICKTRSLWLQIGPWTLVNTY
jgi:hypothetical protein